MRFGARYVMTGEQFASMGMRAAREYVLAWATRGALTQGHPAPDEETTAWRVDYQPYVGGWSPFPPAEEYDIREVRFMLIWQGGGGAQ